MISTAFKILNIFLGMGGYTYSEIDNYKILNFEAQELLFMELLDS